MTTKEADALGESDVIERISQGLILSAEPSRFFPRCPLTGQPEWRHYVPLWLTRTEPHYAAFTRVQEARR